MLQMRAFGIILEFLETVLLKPYEDIIELEWGDFLTQGSASKS